MHHLNYAITLLLIYLHITIIIVFIVFICVITTTSNIFVGVSSSVPSTVSLVVFSALTPILLNFANELANCLHHVACA